MRPFSSKWKQIGENLGFTAHELQNIEATPTHFTSGPPSNLGQMLCEWQQWAPGDARGSSSYATLEALVQLLKREEVEVSIHAGHQLPEKL